MSVKKKRSEELFHCFRVFISDFKRIRTNPKRKKKKKQQTINK